MYYYWKFCNLSQDIKAIKCGQNMTLKGSVIVDIIIIIQNSGCLNEIPKVDESTFRGGNSSFDLYKKEKQEEKH